MRSLSLRLAPIALVAALSVFAVGCDSGSASESSITMKLDGDYIRGSQTVTEYVPGSTNWVRLSRGFEGSGMTVAIGFTATPAAGTYALADMSAAGVQVGSGAQVGVFQRYNATVSPSATTHRVTSGTVTISSVTETIVSGTFTTTLASGSGSASTLTGSFRAMR